MAGAGTLLAGVLLVGAGGCGSAVNPAAIRFIESHSEGSAAVRAAVGRAEAALASLSQPPRPAQLRALSQAARTASERVAEARSSLPTDEAPEEELPTAEAEAGVGARELARAMADLERYARRPEATPLASYRLDMAAARQKWNDAFREIYRLANESHPPVL
jgi:hypothetical protein